MNHRPFDVIKDTKFKITTSNSFFFFAQLEASLRLAETTLYTLARTSSPRAVNWDLKTMVYVSDKSTAWFASRTEGNTQFAATFDSFFFLF